MLQVNQTIGSLHRQFHDELSDVYERAEVEQIVRLAFQYVLQLSKEQWLVSKADLVGVDHCAQLMDVICQLKMCRPVEYVFNKAEFYGLTYFVNEHVLVPRPETEELVAHILNSGMEGDRLSMLDAGTGSGCMAITLKRFLPGCEVVAMDISPEALVVAKKNAKDHRCDIRFLLADMFSDDWLTTLSGLDVLVSNPPYVTVSEKRFMKRNVLDYEPPHALFVADDEPLIYYQRLMSIAMRKLNPGGRVYLEINEHFGQAVTLLFLDKGFKQCRVLKDLNGRDRFLVANL